MKNNVCFTYDLLILLFTETETLAGYVTEHWHKFIKSLGLFGADAMEYLETTKRAGESKYTCKLT